MAPLRLYEVSCQFPWSLSPPPPTCLLNLISHFCLRLMTLLCTPSGSTHSWGSPETCFWYSSFPCSLVYPCSPCPISCTPWLPFLVTCGSSGYGCPAGFSLAAPSTVCATGNCTQADCSCTRMWRKGDGVHCDLFVYGCASENPMYARVGTILPGYALNDS